MARVEEHLVRAEVVWPGRSFSTRTSICGCSYNEMSLAAKSLVETVVEVGCQCTNIPHRVIAGPVVAISRTNTPIRAGDGDR